MSYKQVVHNVIKLLPEDVPPFSIVGSGSFGVCIDTHSKKRKIQNAYKPFKLVTLLTTERSKEEMDKISEIKKSLYHKGVHIALSDNIKQLNCDPEDYNPYLMQAMIEYNGTYYEPYDDIRNAIIYDEVFVEGQNFKIKEEEQYQEAALIPQQHITKLIFDTYRIAKSGLKVDVRGDNLLYNAKKGFYFIDLGLTDVTDDSNSMWVLTSVITALCGVASWKIEDCSQACLPYLLAYATKIEKAIDLLLKAFPTMPQDKFFEDWFILLKHALDIRKHNYEYDKKIENTEDSLE